MTIKLLDQVRETARLKHLSLRTEEAYVQWIKRYVLFHKKRHPMALGENEIRQFLTYLVQSKYVSSSTQNQALNVRTAHRTDDRFAKQPAIPTAVWRADKITCPQTCPEMLLFRIFLLGIAALFSKGTKRIDTLSDHSQHSPNPTHPDKIYYIADSIAIKNPDVLQTPGFMGRG